MVQGVLIVCFAVMVGHDAVRAGPSKGVPGSWGALVGTVVPISAACFIAHLVISYYGRRLDETGRAVHIIRAERTLAALRLALAALFVYGVVGTDWLGAVRSVTTDVPAVDELLCLSPVLLGLCAGWASFYAIDRRLREAALMGALDGDGPLAPMPPLLQYVGDHFRHGVLVLLAPMLAISAWSESVTLAANALAADHGALADSAGFAWMVSAAHFGGVLLVLGLMPLGLRRIWRTTDLVAGPLRDTLAALCERQGVRCSGFLVWHTHTGMVNGALLGVLPWARYILLTDALLERMSPREVEAVMAHEVGHAARRHIPWMGAAVIASSTIAYAVLVEVMPVVLPEWAYVRLDSGERIGPEFALAVVFGLLVFGWVSRRFERQADAFAVQHLSGWSPRRGGPSPAPLIMHGACESMGDALRHVARHARIDPRRFTFRHGSIASRIEAVRSIAGVAADNIPIDRTVRRIKVLTALGVLAAIILALLD